MTISTLSRQRLQTGSGWWFGNRQKLLFWLFNVHNAFSLILVMFHLMIRIKCKRQDIRFMMCKANWIYLPSSLHCGASTFVCRFPNLLHNKAKWQFIALGSSICLTNEQLLLDKNRTWSRARTRQQHAAINRRSPSSHREKMKIPFRLAANQ